MAMRAEQARPMRADARRNRERLLDAAGQAVAEQGAEVALEEVARRAGVGTGTLYRHFPTRGDLLQAVMAGRYATLTERIREEVAEAATPCAALFAFMRLFLEHMAATRGLTTAVKPALKDDTTQLSAAHRRVRDLADALLAEAQEAGEVRTDVTAVDVFRLVVGVVWSTEHMDCDPVEAGRLLSVVTAGLRA